MRRGRTSYRLYQLDDDGPCARVRRRLNELGVSYAGVLVPERPEERLELLDLTGQRRVPVLVDGEILVIGEREVISYVERATATLPVPHAEVSR
jgi:glutaredoxin 3